MTPLGLPEAPYRVLCDDCKATIRACATVAESAAGGRCDGCSARLGTRVYMGYTVEWTGDDRAPAVLHGARGACYGLMRPANAASEWCYCVSLAGAGKGTIVRAKGNAWLQVPRGTRTITGAK